MYRILKVSTCLLCLVFFCGSAEGTIFETSGDIEMELNGAPNLNQIVDLNVIVTSAVDAPGSSIEVRLPEGIIPINSITSWNADLVAGVPSSNSIQIKVVQEGVWEISASASTSDSIIVLIGLGSLVLNVDSLLGEVTTYSDLVTSIMNSGPQITEELTEYPGAQYFDPSVYMQPGHIYTEPFNDDDAGSRGCDGHITVKGYFYHYDENGNLQPLVNASVNIWDDDVTSGDDLLGSTITGWDGYFEVANIENCDCWLCGTLDV